MSIRTIKLPYKSESLDVISKYVANYNNVLRFTYNRLVDNDFKLSTKQLTEMQKSMNNIFIDSHFLNSAQYLVEDIIICEDALAKYRIKNLNRIDYSLCYLSEKLVN